MKYVNYRSIIIIFLVGSVVLIGNLLFHDRQDANATAEKTTSPTLIPVASHELEQKLNQLTLPKAGLSKPKSTPPLIYAKSYILIDDDKYPLAAKNADIVVPNASTTKIMTALVAIDNLKPDQVVTITNHAATINGSEIQLLTGETMTVHNLLYAMLISSANDAAYALADASGSFDGFVAKMNAKAKTMGLNNTHYNDPAGLDNISSARDLAILSYYALGNPIIAEIVRTANYTIWSTDNKYKHDLKNSNRLVEPTEPLYYDQAIGVKTGFTPEAGHCLIAAAQFDDKRYVAVVMNTNDQANDASAKEARKLLVWAGSL